MDSDAEWDDFGTDDMRPIPIGDILPGVLASYGLGEPPTVSEDLFLCGETAAAAFTMTEVS